ISRGSDEIIGDKELKEKLASGRPLTVKFGADPTAPDLHLGHTVVMEKLRVFQELGHKVVFIIGDFTAMIGDPSGRTAERPVLTKEEIEESIMGYKKQIFKILLKNNLELVRNSAWLKKLGAEGLISLTKHSTVARMLERNDFEARYKSGSPITITEFIYPLLQGYDSVEVKADIEIGGTDQKFNLLMGRELQKDMGQDQQAILTMPLLEGTDGVKKMSKSYGNHIGINEPPTPMFGKIMSLSDELMYRYYELLTVSDIAKVKEKHPMEAKRNLAKIIVGKYYGKTQAEAEDNNFKNVFSKGEIPVANYEYTPEKKDEKLINIIYDFYSDQRFDMDCSKSKLKKLFAEGAIKFDGNKITDINHVIKATEEGVVQVGKRYPPFRIVR
ncbi:MAG: tyrosine--tRNA ligase, partial [Elusimicrobia bacterium]|nr:tyrosine--tRNA ligase [Elusimicrobiota bacterium]